MSDGAQLRTLTGYSGYVNGVAFGPDGTTLASGSDDFTINLWADLLGMLAEFARNHSKPYSYILTLTDIPTLTFFIVSKRLCMGRGTMYRVIVLALIFLLIPIMVLAQTGGRINVAVMDLEATGGVAETDKRMLSDRLRTELLNTGRFKVIERNSMEAILKEQGLQLADCTSDECVIEIGQLLGVERMIAGSVGRIGSTHSVNLRMIDVETGEILLSRNVDCVCSIEEVFSTRLNQAARLIAGLDAGIATTPGLAGHGDLFIKSDPEGARIYLDGELMTGATPIVVEKLEAGVHVVRVAKDDFIGQASVFVSAGGMTTTEIPMELGKATLRVYSKPFEAIVFLDEKEVGPTPQSLNDVSAGRHNIVVRMPGYVDHEETVHLGIGEEKTVQAVLVPAHGAIRISASLPRATVSVNGETHEWVLPHTIGDLPFGIYAIEVSASEYEPYSETVSVAERRLHTVHADLRKQRGTLSLTKHLSGTQVYVNGELIGESPLNHELEIGTCNVHLRRPGYEKGEAQQLKVTRDGAVEIAFNLKLKRKSKAFKRSLIWPGLGQLYAERSGPGMLYALGEAAAIGYVYYSITNYNGSVQDFDNAEVDYYGAVGADEIQAAYIAKEEAFDKISPARNQLFISAGLAAGLYLWNIVDVNMFGIPLGVSAGNELGHESSGAALSLTLIHDSKEKPAPGLRFSIRFD